MLAQLPELRVASRTSAFAFNKHEVGIDSIGRALHMAHVLEGSVRRAGNRVRITAQLIDARTGYHLWSEAYDRDYGDVFAIQDEISRAIVAALKLRLSAAPAGTDAQLAEHETSDPEAHTLLLQGMAAQRQQTNASLRRAVELFRAALARDPGYVQARARLAAALGSMAYVGLVPREEAYREAKAEGARVLAADSTNAVALAALGRIADWHDWDWRAARTYYEKALASNPNDAYAHAHLAWLLMRLCQPGRAIAEARRSALSTVTVQDRADPERGIALMHRNARLTLREQTERPIKIAEGTNRVAPWPLKRDGLLDACRTELVFRPASALRAVAGVIQQLYCPAGVHVILCPSAAARRRRAHE